MENTAINLNTLYYPKTAFVVYEAQQGHKEIYVESFDMDENGHPVNTHPLTIREAQNLAKALNTKQELTKDFLRPKGIIPPNILHINPSENGKAIWYTKAMERQLFFIENLGIRNGRAKVPAMLWCATKERLSVFALASDRRPNESTKLYHAPFFNIYEVGNVCMGTVNIEIKKSAYLEEFIKAWETYFFNSYFSHLMAEHNPIKGNCVSLWKKLVKTKENFPKDVLKETNQTIKNLLK